MSLTSNKFSLIFPGQGSQSVGMGRDLSNTYPIALDVFREADEILGMQFSDLMWNGPDTELNDTINTQPALFIHSIAAYRVFQNLFPNLIPSYLAGHSLGELSAIAASGAISLEDGLRLVRKRGELMKRAGDINPGSMAAILALDIPTLDSICLASSTSDEIVQVANDNCPGQIVISGNRSAMARALIKAKEAGAKRALPLAVSIAAHSPLMASIQAEWDGAVNNAYFTTPKIPVIGNVSASVLSSSPDLRADIIAQMQSRVRWTESIKLIHSHNISTYFEVGNGTVLSGLVKRILDGVLTLPLGNPVDFSAIES